MTPLDRGSPAGVTCPRTANDALATLRQTCSVVRRAAIGRPSSPETARRPRGSHPRPPCQRALAAGSLSPWPRLLIVLDIGRDARRLLESVVLESVEWPTADAGRGVRQVSTT